MTTLRQKAEKLIFDGKLHQVDDSTWEATSSNGIDKYTVKWHTSGGNCTCEGFRYNHWCYHLEAVKIATDLPENFKQLVLLDEKLW